MIEYSGDLQNLMFLLTWSTFPTNLLDFCLFEKSLKVKRIKRSEYSKMPRKSDYSKLVYHHRFHCLVLNILSHHKIQTRERIHTLVDEEMITFHWLGGHWLSVKDVSVDFRF